MREIKFRAWDKVEKRFGYVTIHPSQLSWMSPKYSQQNLVMEIDNDISGVEFINIEGWQQFTGLHDKNGKEIYEGDVVYFYLEGTPEDDFGNAEIVFSDGSFCVKHKIGEFRIDKEEVFNEYPFFVIDFTQVEIIGNIYENGDLLR